MTGAFRAEALNVSKHADLLGRTRPVRIRNFGIITSRRTITVIQMGVRFIPVSYE